MTNGRELMRRLTPIWFFILIFAAGAIYLPGFSKYMALKRKEEQVSAEIKKLRAEIEGLKQEEQLLKTNVARLEEVVREELGLVKPGEVVYRVVEEQPETTTANGTNGIAQPKQANQTGAAAAQVPKKATSQ